MTNAYFDVVSRGARRSAGGDAFGVGDGAHELTFVFRTRAVPAVTRTRGRAGAELKKRQAYQLSRSPLGQVGATARSAAARAPGRGWSRLAGAIPPASGNTARTRSAPARSRAAAPHGRRQPGPQRPMRRTDRWGADPTPLSRSPAATGGRTPRGSEQPVGPVTSCGRRVGCGRHRDPDGRRTRPNSLDDTSLPDPEGPTGQ